VPKIDITDVPERKGSGYPPPFDAPCAERIRQRLGNAGGLADFGVNLMHLPPGNWSSQRHWHSHEDEFVYVIEGELTLIEDGGETVLRAGDCAAFPKGSGNGHHMINRSGAMAVYLEVGSRQPEDLTTCSDIDMMSSNANGRFVHKDGMPYTEPWTPPSLIGSEGVTHKGANLTKGVGWRTTRPASGQKRRRGPRHPLTAAPSTAEVAVPSSHKPDRPEPN
jgi:uncharacterized cupin superfamily protein